jgi:hypothetical protein
MRCAALLTSWQRRTSSWRHSCRWQHSWEQGSWALLGAVTCLLAAAPPVCAPGSDPSTLTTCALLQSLAHTAKRQHQRHAEDAALRLAELEEQVERQKGALRSVPEVPRGIPSP